MPLRKPAGARPAARKCAPRKKSAAPRRKAASSKSAPLSRKTTSKLNAKPKPSRRATRRVTPFGVITVRSGRPLSYTPELKAHARFRFEQTPESAYSIAADLGMHHTSLKRLAQREGWVRHNPPPVRDITGVMRLADEVEALTSVTPTPTLPLAGGGSQTAFAAPPSHENAAPDTSAIDRLEAAVLMELSVVERMRVALGPEPLRPFDAQITARTLSSLTETLSKLRRLRLASAPPARTADFDDIPEDIDEFRFELARRIEAFVASRTGDETLALGDPPPLPPADGPGWV
jgi:hypothetical protein